MASRTKLISIQAYDSDGGLNYAIHGSQWSKWYLWRKASLEKSKAPDIVRAIIRLEMLGMFNQALDVAMRLADEEFNPPLPEQAPSK